MGGFDPTKIHPFGFIPDVGSYSWYYQVPGEDRVRIIEARYAGLQSDFLNASAVPYSVEFKDAPIGTNVKRGKHPPELNRELVGHLLAADDVIGVLPCDYEALCRTLELYPTRMPSTDILLRTLSDESRNIGKANTQYQLTLGQGLRRIQAEARKEMEECAELVGVYTRSEDIPVRS